MKQPPQSASFGTTPQDPAPAFADTNSELFTPTPATESSLLDQVKPLLDKAKQVLNELPQSVKQARSKATTGFNQLSTTQKVVGGGLLLFLGARLLTGDRKSRNQQADTLHELLHFVNDRLEGYKKAFAESQDQEFRSYYQQLANQSRRFANELNSHLNRLGDKRETGTTLKGKLYRRLMEATAAVTGHDEKAILATNLHGEQWAIAAYEEALKSGTLKGPLRRAVSRQLTYSKQTYQELQELASQEQAAN